MYIKWHRSRNWLHETKKQELERRLKAVESSVRNAHDRINQFDERMYEQLIKADTSINDDGDIDDSSNHSVSQ